MLADGTGRMFCISTNYMACSCITSSFPALGRGFAVSKDVGSELYLHLEQHESLLEKLAGHLPVTHRMGRSVA